MGLAKEVIARFQDDSLEMEVHTSGSTGVPKSIRIPKRYMEASAKMTLTFLGLQKGDRALLCMSPAHIGGIMMVIRALLGELKLEVVEPSARPLENLDGSFDFAAMVPYQVEASMDDLHRIKNLIIGGGPISPELEERLKVLPNNIYHTYGMTETISHIAMRKVNGADNEWFKVMPDVELKTDARGCLVINAPNLGASGIVTNDLVELEDSKTFKWLGRIDNVVNSAGLKLHPESIEQKIGSIGQPYFLAGIKDPKLGESLVMIVEGDTPEQSKLDQYFTGLHKYEMPKQVFSISHFRMTESGKLSRRATLEFLKLV